MKRTQALTGLGLTLFLALPAGAARIHRKPLHSKKIHATVEQLQQTLAQGIQALDRHHYPQAIQLFQKATRMDPNSAEAFYQLGNSYYRWAFQLGSSSDANKDDAQQAITSYRIALSLDPNQRRISSPYLLHLGLAMCHQAIGQYGSAISELKTASHISPNNPMPALYAALVRYRMEDIPNSTANLDLSARLAQRARVYPTLSKLVRTNPIFSDLLKVPLNKAIFDTYDKKDAEVAFNYQENALRDAPASDIRKKPLGVPMQISKVEKFIQQGDEAFKYRHFNEALGAYTAALDEDKNTGSLDMARKSLIYERLGASFRQLGLTIQAIYALHKSIVESPANSSAYYQMALAYSTVGHYSEAIDSLNSALKNAHTTGDLRRILVMAKTDSEMDPLRDMPEFRKIIKLYAARR